MTTAYRHPVDYATGQPGDHAPADCAELRTIADRRYRDRLPSDESVGGYHAGWGICAGDNAGWGYAYTWRDVRRASLSPWLDMPAKDLGR